MNNGTYESIGDMARARMTGRTRGSNLTVRVPPLAAGLGAGLQSVPQKATFRRAGLVYTMQGQVASAADADMAGLEVRVQIGGTRDLFTDGEAGTFMPFLMLFGKNQNWWPLDIEVPDNQDWIITYRNTTAATTIVPSLAFNTLVNYR